MLLRAEILSALALAIGLGLVFQGSPDAPARATAEPQQTAPVSFSEQIMPIFEQYCTECHGNMNAELGLNLSTYEGVMQGSDYGTVVEPGNPDGSLLIDMIESGDMPEEGDPVPPAQLELIKTWIAEGAENN